MPTSRPPAPLVRCTILAVLAVGIAGCTADTRFSQAQLDAIQTRELDVPADRAYRAVIGALLEQCRQKQAKVEELELSAAKTNTIVKSYQAIIK